MNRIVSSLDNLTERQIYLSAVVLSLLFSCLAYIQNPIAGVDAARYIHSADAFLSDGLKGAAQVYDYPTYPVLIALVHKLTGLALPLSAICINAVLQALLIYVFLRLLVQCYNGKRLLLIGSAVILLNPEFNSLRWDGLRDHGYWAFVFFALLQFILFNHTARLRNVLGWNIACLLAAYFRPEAIVFLAAPLIYLLYWPVSFIDSAIRLVKIYAIPALLLVAYFAFASAAAAELVSGFVEVVTARVLHGQVEVLQGFNALVAVYEQDILGDYNGDVAGFSLVMGLFAILVFRLYQSVHIFYLLTWLWGARISCLRMKKSAQLPVRLFALAFLLMPIMFLLRDQFVQSRYLMAFSLLLCIPVSMAVLRLHETWLQHRWHNGMAVFVILVLFIDSSTSFGSSYSHAKDAVVWVNAKTPSNSLISANTIRILPYIDRPQRWALSDQLAGGKVAVVEACKESDWYIHGHSRRAGGVHESLPSLDASLVKFFENNRHHHFDIYRCH